MQAANIGPSLMFGALVVVIAVTLAGLQWREHYDQTPTWYRLAFYACCAVAALCAWLGLVGVDFEIITKDTATFWGGLVAAVVTLTSFLLGRFADEMTKAQAATEGRARVDEIRREDRLSLAFSLYAEIKSNVEQQRRTFTQDVIDLKIRRMQVPKETSEATSAQAPQTSGYKTASAPPDMSQPFYKIATEKYDLIPTEAITALVEHYNIDTMANIIHGSIASEKFDTLQLDQKYQMMAVYYETLLDYDESGVQAANRLADFINTNDTGSTRGTWHGLQPRDSAFRAYAQDRIAWLRVETFAEISKILKSVPHAQTRDTDQTINPGSGQPQA